MKNLANCTPKEFFVQTNKIRHKVANWLKEIGFSTIRQNKPELLPINDDMSDDERSKAKAENKKRLEAQFKKNVSDCLDKALETNVDDTLEVLALLCFIDPKDVNNHKPTEFLKCFAEIIGDKDVIDFFTSLMQLDQMNILDFPKA